MVDVVRGRILVENHVLRNLLELRKRNVNCFSFIYFCSLLFKNVHIRIFDAKNVREIIYAIGSLEDLSCMDYFTIDFYKTIELNLVLEKIFLKFKFSYFYGTILFHIIFFF